MLEEMIERVIRYSTMSTTATTKDKNKNDLIQAYQYMTGYHLFKQENQKGKEFLTKILELDPENADAKAALKEINNPPQQKPKKR